MSSALTVLREQIKNFYLIRRLSVYEMKSANSNNYLGILWEIINPMIQISIYWFVFGFGIHNRKDIDEHSIFPLDDCGDCRLVFCEPSYNSNLEIHLFTSNDGFENELSDECYSKLCDFCEAISTSDVTSCYYS